MLNIGEIAIAGAAHRIKDLKAAGNRVLVVSNAAGFPHAGMMEKYDQLGYEFAPEDVITCRATLLARLNGQRGLHRGLMATRSTGLRDLKGLILTYLEGNPAHHGTVDGFLMIGAAAWTETHQALLVEALAKRPRSVLVGNPDIVESREQEFST